MVARDVFETVADGDQLNEGYFNGITKVHFKHLASDQTVGSMAGTTETKIGEVTVTANEVTNGVLVIATGKTRNESFGKSTTIKLIAGENAAFASNTTYKTISRFVNNSGITESGWCIVYFIDDLDWTATNYVQITGDGSDADQDGTCESIELLHL